MNTPNANGRRTLFYFRHHKPIRQPESRPVLTIITSGNRSQATTGATNQTTNPNEAA